MLDKQIQYTVSAWTFLQIGDTVQSHMCEHTEIRTDGYSRWMLESAIDRRLGLYTDANMYRILNNFYVSSRQ